MPPQDDYDEATSVPPSYGHLLLDLVDDMALLTSLLRTLSYGVTNGESAKKISTRLRLCWDTHKFDRDLNREGASQGAAAKKLFFGDAAVEREYIARQITSIYGEIVNTIPSKPECEICGYRDADGSSEETIQLCEGCDTFLCEKHFNSNDHVSKHK
jgi:hypothetical protein